MKIIFHYDANKTHFHNKGFALSLVLKVRFLGTRKWPIDYRTEIEKLTFRALALRQNESRNCGLCKVYIQKMELRYWWELGDVRNRNKLNE